MNSRKKFLSLLLIVSLFVGMVGIVNIDTAYAASKKKTHIMTKTVSMYLGQNYQQKLLSSKGKTIKAKKVKWKSKNNVVATINKKGLITAVNLGEAKMTAKYKGKTYKFTVVVTPVPTPAPAPTPTPAPTPSDSNSYISFNTDSLYVLKGYYDTVEVNTDKGESVTYDINNNNVSCSWGDWIDGTNTVELEITGEKIGTSIVTVYDTNNPLVRDTLEVHVVGALQLLQAIVNEDGYTNGNGHKTLKTQIDDNNQSFIIDEGNNQLRFSYFATTSSTDYDSIAQIDMYLKLPESATASPEITFAITNSSTSNELNLKAHTTISVEDYSKDDSVYFIKDDGNLTLDFQDLCNSYLRLAMSGWALTLAEHGLSLESIGFTNY